MIVTPNYLMPVDTQKYLPQSIKYGTFYTPKILEDLKTDHCKLLFTTVAWVMDTIRWLWSMVEVTRLSGRE